MLPAAAAATMPHMAQSFFFLTGRFQPGIDTCLARETVSLALTQLRNKSLLRTGRNQLIYDPRALEAFERVLQQTKGTAEGRGGRVVEQTAGGLKMDE